MRSLAFETPEQVNDWPRIARFALRALFLSPPTVTSNSGHEDMEGGPQGPRGSPRGAVDKLQQPADDVADDMADDMAHCLPKPESSDRGRGSGRDNATSVRCHQTVPQNKPYSLF